MSTNALGRIVRMPLPSGTSLGIGHLVRFDTRAKGNASHILVKGKLFGTRFIMTHGGNIPEV